MDLEVGALALEGLAHVTQGEPAAGQLCLDEAMTAIVSGELTDLAIIGTASCHVIAACERTHDCERAAQWCERLKEFSARWRIRPLFAVCRALYAGICLSRGAWPEAEAELTSAASELAASHPAAVPEALARLGELRRRQGRFDEAAALFTDAAQHPLAVLGRAALALDQAPAVGRAGAHRAVFAAGAPARLHRSDRRARPARARGLGAVGSPHGRCRCRGARSYCDKARDGSDPRDDRQ